MQSGKSRLRRSGMPPSEKKRTVPMEKGWLQASLAIVLVGSITLSGCAAKPNAGDAQPTSSTTTSDKQAPETPLTGAEPSDGNSKDKDTGREKPKDEPELEAPVPAVPQEEKPAKEPNGTPADNLTENPDENSSTTVETGPKQGETAVVDKKKPTPTAAESTYGGKSNTTKPKQPNKAGRELSWYYMKKKKGVVPDFPAAKAFKPEQKVVWVGTGKNVYLTFDTGSGLGDADKLLKALKDGGVKATFFVTGRNIKKNPEFIKQAVEEGHLVLNHSMSHRSFTEMTDDEVKKEIADTETSYKAVTGQELEKFFRFPYGKYNSHLLQLVADLGYTSVFWSTAMKDWVPRKNGADDAYNDIINHLHDGDIILMHQNSKENVEALPRIIKKIEEEGYHFSLVSDLTPSQN